MGYVSTTIQKLRYLVSRDDGDLLILQKENGSFINVSLDTPASRDAAITTAVNNLLAGVPGALDTLNELATALGDDANFAATVTTSLGNRLAWKGAWAATFNYVRNDLVLFNGGLYVALANFTSGASFVKANWIELIPPSGTYALTAGAEFKGDGAYISGAVDLSNRALTPVAFPGFSQDLTRYAGNPVLLPGSLPPFSGTVADPAAIQIDGVLYGVFEFESPGPGQIWRAESTDQGKTWTNWIKVSQNDSLHYHDPQIFEHLGEVHVCFQNSETQTDPGAIYHVSAPLAGWRYAPVWTTQMLMFDSATAGMPHRFTEFVILQENNVWFLLMVGGDKTSSEDTQLWGFWSGTFILDWNTYGIPMTNPIYDTTNSTWLRKFTHPSVLQLGGKTSLIFGIDIDGTGYHGVGIFHIDSLTPDRGIQGTWTEQTFTFGRSAVAGAWDGTTASIHRACAVLANGTWVWLYDGLLNSVWCIGVAYMDPRGAPRSSYPTAQGRIHRPPIAYSSGMGFGIPVQQGVNAPIVVPQVSVWGISVDGRTYFNPSGVTPGDEAIFGIDNVSGQPMLTRMVG